MTRIETEVLREVANRLAATKEQYETEIAKLYAEIENLSVSYEGRSSATFHAKMEEARADFNAIGALLQDYSEYLVSVATNTEITENAVTEAAQKL